MIWTHSELETNLHERFANVRESRDVTPLRRLRGLLAGIGALFGGTAWVRRPRPFYDVIRRQGITRRSFVQILQPDGGEPWTPGPVAATQMAHALETKPRIPVIWMHGLECTCCSESFIRSSHPLVKDVVLSMVSLDYDDTLMAAAGHQADEILPGNPPEI